MMKKNWMHARRTMAVILALGSLATIGTAAALEDRPTQPVKAAAQTAPAGTLVLGAGAAEIAVGYDAQGRVCAVTGSTEAGRRIVADELRDGQLNGRTACAVVYELVDALEDDGYLMRESDLTVRAAHSSAYPTTTFFSEIEQAARAAMLEDRHEADGRDDRDDTDWDDQYDDDDDWDDRYDDDDDWDDRYDDDDDWDDRHDDDDDDDWDDRHDDDDDDDWDDRYDDDDDDWDDQYDD